jgi:hypothetical protein
MEKVGESQELTEYIIYPKGKYYSIYDKWNGQELGEIYNKHQGVDLLLDIFENFNNIPKYHDIQLFVQLFSNKHIPSISKDEQDFLLAIREKKLVRIDSIEYQIVFDPYLTDSRGSLYYSIYAIHEGKRKYRGYFNNRYMGLFLIENILTLTSQNMPMYHGAKLMTQICRLEYKKSNEEKQKSVLSSNIIAQ